MHFITYLELFSKEWDSQVINMDWYLFIWAMVSYFYLSWNQNRIFQSYFVIF
jgi:hypothetical protein